MKLYEIAAQYQEFLELVQDTENDLSMDDSVVTDTLSSIEGEFEVKAVNTAAVLKTLQSEADAIAAAMQAMTARKKALESRADSLKSYLLHNMQAMCVQKIKHPYFNISVNKSPESVFIENESLIGEEFKKVVVTIDKVLIKEALKAGKAVAGCALVRGEHLRIG
jgi:hypothetical protein